MKAPEYNITYNWLCKTVCAYGQDCRKGTWKTKTADLLGWLNCLSPCLESNGCLINICAMSEKT